MLEKLEKEINLTDELLNGLPVNNRKNKERFLKEISLEMESYQKKIDEVTYELKRRLEEFENLKYESVLDSSSTLQNLLNALSYTNSLSSPFEKLDLDKIIYQLSSFGNDELISTNLKILKALNIFKEVGINISIKDFNYSNDVKEYMQMFFTSELTNEKIKEVFDKIYWQCPDIITQIELNIRNIYIKNTSKCEKYIEKINKQIKDKFDKAETTLLNDYYYLRRQYDPYANKTNLILDFYNQKLDISLYTDEKINEITSTLFINNDFDSSKIDTIIQLQNSLKEYKNYLKYKDLIDKAKNLYNENLEKGYFKKTLKKISKLESKLFKLSKKTSNTSSKTKVDKLEPQVNGKISEIKALYDEIDNNLFKIMIKEHIKENSTIFKVFLLVCQYYRLLGEYFKEKDESITMESLDKNIKELMDFVMDPNNTLINNITILEEFDFSEVILTNYKLLNIDITSSLESEDSIEELINNLEKIIVNDKMKKLNIDIKKLEDAKAIQGLELK